MRCIKLVKMGSPDDPAPIGLSVTIMKRGVRSTHTVWMTEDEAQHLSNRLQSVAKGQGDGRTEVIIDRPSIGD